MSEHYFSSQPKSRSTMGEIDAQLLGNNLRFITAAGVFAKREVDFGTHLLIETILINHSATLLDLGCGYGPVGIALAKAYPQLKVTMIDVNERAVQLAQENIKLNGVEDRVEVLLGNGFESLSGYSYDLIVTNPPLRVGKDTIYSWYLQAEKYLTKIGSLWVVVRKQQGAATTLRFLSESYIKTKMITRKKGYWILQAGNIDLT